MAAEKDRFDVVMMARCLGVSRSGFYAWLRRRPAEGPCPDPWGEDRKEVLRIWESSKGVFGARTIHSLLPHLTLYRVRKCMRELGICGIHPRLSKRATVPDPAAPERPDLICRDFESPVPTVKLVGDITYLRTGEGWLYMATVIDLCTRMVVGLAFSERMTADLPISALEIAHSRGFVAEGAIFHSDRGSQYTSKAMARWASDHDVRLSAGRTGSCHDNAVAESFFGTFKNEMYHQDQFATRAQARLASLAYVEGFYNRERPHSAIDYQVPAQKMDAFMQRMDALVEREESLLLAA